MKKWKRQKACMEDKVSIHSQIIACPISFFWIYYVQITDKLFDRVLSLLFVLFTDETFNEVFRDFTHMANNAPEKLNRNRNQPAS